MEKRTVFMMDESPICPQIANNRNDLLEPRLKRWSANQVQELPASGEITSRLKPDVPEKRTRINPAFTSLTAFD
jgi:hypothetical protein